MPELHDDLAALKIERAPERTSSRGWVRWVVLLVFLGGAGYAAYAFFTRERPVEVEAAWITERAAGSQARVLDANGYVTARRRATVSSKITGKVIEVNVEEGMAVREGQVLARLDDLTARAALALAEAQVSSAQRAVSENEVRLAEAKLTYNRRAALVKDGIIGQAELDAAKAEVDSIAARIAALRGVINVADRQVDLAKVDLDNTIIRAPFSGVAISKDAQPGEMVSPVSAGGGFTRTGICTIVDMRSLEIEVDVSESRINRVTPDMDATAILDAYPDWPIPASVITTVPTADRAKNTVRVRLRFKVQDPRILPDMAIKVEFLRPADEKEVVAKPMPLVPKAAVRSENNESIVFVVNGDTVERRAIKTGLTDGDRLEVLAGLRRGDRVVLSPPPTLTAGMKIAIR